ncbi:MAG: RNA methyltransferase [Hyellaceae cyanobacterium CSU_1_1]|nr:RNA methyltransferase [Pleurocapsa sp. CRU_1_2]NJR44591.1 RNA methyltransferase [Hyellaceae cyanobacterium CSU_1_1]
MKQNLLTNIRIVLVEPIGALNVGSIARIMKNMGLTKLVLVNPRCDLASDEARQMAVHAVDILETAQIVDSIPTALAGCQQAIATTVRSRSVPILLESSATVLPKLLVPNLQSALLFGAEDRGLSNDELKYAQRFICIESNPDYPSLNLAQAVTICVYQLYQSWLEISNAQISTSVEFAPAIAAMPNNATIEVLEGYYQDLEAMLLEIGYLYPHTVAVKMEKFRRLYNKANLQPEEVAMLRGILRQIRWANHHQAKLSQN